MINYFLILNNCSGSQYGIGTYVKQLFDGLKRKDYNLSIIEMSAEVKDFSCVKDRSGIATYKIPALNMDMGAYCKIAYYLIIQNIPQFDKMVFHFNFDHHEPLMHLLREHYSGCRIIITVHYLDWCFELDGNYTKFKKIINSDKIMNSKEGNVMKSFNKEKYAFNSSDEVIVLSEKTKSILIKDYKIPQDKVHLIRNGLSGKSVCSCDNNVSMNEKRILFVGRLDEQKGLKLVINAFKDIAEKLPSAKLYIVGNGNYDHFLPLCEGYRDRIVFTGKMKRCDLEKMYRTASLGVLPSYHEQCSYTIIEMMKFGIPLITSDRMDNLIDNSECVVPIPCVNRINTKVVTRLLSEKMLAILSDKDKWQSLSNKMRTLFDEAYTQHKMVMDLNEMITNSFNRKQYIVPNDYLYILDKKMFSLILSKPDIDFQFFGMGGICAYLWYRIEELRTKKDIYSREQFYDLQKFLLFYVDWIDEVLDQAGSDMEICCQLPIVFSKMLEKHFYKTKTQKVLNKISNGFSDNDSLAARDIIENAIKIYNCSL